MECGCHRCCAWLPVPRLKAAFMWRSSGNRHNPPNAPARPMALTMHKSITVFLAALLLLAFPLAGWSDGGRAHGDDHDRARAALKAGEVLPLADILARVAVSHPGQVLEVELERDHGVWMYELKLLQTDGLLVKLKVDARDGAVVRQKKGKS
jgi:uncharacterized membrane protein YkoI